MKRLLSALIPFLAAMPVMAQAPTIPETAEDFKNTYHVDSSLDNIIHYALNPALNAIWNNVPAAGLPTNNPTFTGDMTAGTPVGGYIGNYMFLQGANNALWFYRGAAPLNQKEWKFYPDGVDTLHFALDDDAQNPVNDWLTVKRSGTALTNLYLNGPVTVRAPGVIGDGTTDNCTPLNAALQAGPVHLPRPVSVTNFYRTSCTIIVPHGSGLYGEGLVSDWPSGIVGGVEIRCDNGVMICVQLGDNVNIGNKTGEISRIKAGRAGSSAPAGSVGFKLVGGFVPRLDNVVSDNHDVCYLLKTPPGTGSGLSAQLTKIHTGRCQDVHVWNDSFPEVRIESSRFGMSSSGGNAYFRMSCSQRNCTGAGTPSGWFVNNSQFNSADAAHPVNTLFDFSNASDNSTQFFAGDWGEVNMSDCHIEMVNHMITSDSTFYQIKFFQMANNTVATLGTLFALNANTNIWRWNLTGNHFSSVGTSVLNMPAAASSANIQDLMWTGGTYYGSLTLTGVGAATAYIANVSWGGDLTINGSFQAFNETGDNISGSYTEAITGPGSPPNVTVVNNRKLRHTGVTGVTCASVNAATLTSWNGLVTHC
jgi:hypothetical protein